MIHRAEEALRKELEEMMSHEIPAMIWRIVCASGTVGETLEGGYQKEDLLWDCQTLERYAEHLAPPARRSWIGPEGRTTWEVVRREVSAYPELDALSEIMGLEASEDPEVVGFRKDILGGRLVLPSAVEKWIGEESVKCEVRLKSAQTEEDKVVMLDQVLRWRGSPPVPCVLPDWPGRSESVPEETLEYPIPGRTESPLDFGERSVVVPARGPLFLLKFVAAGLMEKYPWSEAQAVGFVLSGVVPRLPTARITNYRLFPSRIVLDLDPGLNARTIISEYRRAQRALLNVRQRAKVQSEKHLRLAVFVAKGKNGTWSDMMEAWNNQSRPEWAYTDSRRFERDSNKALATLRQRRDRARLPSFPRRTETTYGLR